MEGAGPVVTEVWAANLSGKLCVPPLFEIPGETMSFFLPEAVLP